MPIWSRYRYRVEDYWPLIQVLRQSNKYTHGRLVPLGPLGAADPERRWSKAESDAEFASLLWTARGEAAADWVKQLRAAGPLADFQVAKVRERYAVAPREDGGFRFQPDLNAPNLLGHRRYGPREVKGTRVLAVPEGWVILGKKSAYRGLPDLQDLRCSPSIRLVPFIIRWRPEFSDQKLGRRERKPEREDRTLEEGRLSLQVNRDFVRLKLRVIREMTGRKHFYQSGPEGMVAAWKKEGELIKGVNQVTRELIALKRWAFVESDTYSAYDSEVRRLVRIWLTSVRHHQPESARALMFTYLVPWRYNPEGLPSKLALAQQHHSSKAVAVKMEGGRRPRGQASALPDASGRRSPPGVGAARRVQRHCPQARDGADSIEAAKQAVHVALDLNSQASAQDLVSELGRDRDRD